MQDPAIRSYLEKTMFEEIIPTLDLPCAEVEGFAASVIDRFDNPYIDHQLLDIALNSASKRKARVMPSLTEYVKRKGTLPKRLSFSLAAFIAFYHKGERNGEAYPVRDDQWVLDFFAAHKDDDNAALACAVIENEQLWDGALAAIPGLVSATDLTAAGAHLILFTTGRGTPFGAPAPTVKISTNTALYEKKDNWIDFNAGSVAEGENLDAAGDRLLDFVLAVASGKKTKSEERGAREIAIFKDGVTL